MKVKRLEIESFRGIENLVLDFQTDLPNVFIGVNGSGKSSVLQAISFLLMRYVDLLQSRISGGRLAAETLEKASDGSLADDPRSLLSSARAAIFVELSDGQIAAWRTSDSLEWIEPVEHWPKIIPTGITLQQATAQTQQAIEAELSGWPVLVYYPVSREVEYRLKFGDEEPQRGLVAPAYTTQVQRAISFQTVEFDEFFNWFKREEDIENEDRRENSAHRSPVLQAVRKSIYSFLPGYSDLRVRRKAHAISMLKNGSQEIIVNQLSDGEKGLLALVGDLARQLSLANPNSSDALKEQGVVVIDEIENHLHPEWQRGIIPKLTETFPNCQVIAATHSPQVISDLQPESVFVLDKVAIGDSCAYHPEISYGRDSNSILEDVMGVPERPASVKADLQQLFRYIADGDIDAARQIQQKLSDLIGDDEPEFAKADVLIRRKEILGK